MRKKGGRNKNTARVTKARLKAGEVVRLRAMGNSFQGIADRLGYNSRQAAFYAYKQFMDDYVQEVGDTARNISLERHRIAMEKLMPKVARGQLAAIDMLIKLDKRIAQIQGTDAPAKAELTGADGGPIETKEVEVEKELQKPERLNAVLDVAKRHGMLDRLLGYMGEDGPPSEEGEPATRRSGETRPEPHPKVE